MFWKSDLILTYHGLPSIKAFFVIFDWLIQNKEIILATEWIPTVVKDCAGLVKWQF